MHSYDMAMEINGWYTKNYRLGHLTVNLEGPRASYTYLS